MFRPLPPLHPLLDSAKFSFNKTEIYIKVGVKSYKIANEDQKKKLAFLKKGTQLNYHHHWTTFLKIKSWKDKGTNRMKEPQLARTAVTYLHLWGATLKLPRENEKIQWASRLGLYFEAHASHQHSVALTLEVQSVIFVDLFIMNLILWVEGSSAAISFGTFDCYPCIFEFR
ncbi:Transmembrane 9 Superfamily Member 2 [Manis pentadactyla]|nr:Transmembrane 9 Superfamily Member 2 [Manis pentadactyla]